MARTFWDGADLYSEVAQIAIKWHVWQGIDLIGGRFGERAFELREANSRLCRVLPATDRHSVGAAVRLNGFSRAPNQGLQFSSDTAFFNAALNRQIGWTVDAEGRISVFRGANTLLWQSLPGLVPNLVWTYIGFSAIIHPTEGSFSVTVKGQTVVEQTGINTRGLSDNNFTSVNFGIGDQVSAAKMALDDIYFDDAYLSLTPERRIETLRPIADIDSAGFTPSTGTTLFGVVDELLLDSSDYMSAAVPGDFAEFELSNLSNIPTVIDGVQATGFAQKMDAATRAINYRIGSGGSYANGPDIYLGASLEQGWNNVLLNPNGSVAWNAAAVNAMTLRTQVAV